jgi:hypothetical protein
MQYGRRYARWAMWGCAGLLLACALLFVGFLLVTLQRPEGKNLLTASEHVAECREHLIRVAGALDRYHKDKGKAPARLEDLYPTYLANKADLHCPADSRTDATSYVYRPAIPWGKGDDIVVYCPHHPLPMKIRGVAAADLPYILLFIRQDGRVDRKSATISQIRALTGKPSAAR